MSADYLNLVSNMNKPLMIDHKELCQAIETSYEQSKIKEV